MRAAAALVAALIVIAGCSAPQEPEPRSLRMLHPRAAHTATALSDGRILLAGGCTTTGCSTATRTTELFDGTHFRPGPRLKAARDSHTATSPWA